MPQMGPMLWLNLFILFSFSLICFIVFNYYIFSPQKVAVSSKQIQDTEKIWKWWQDYSLFLNHPLQFFLFH